MNKLQQIANIVLVTGILLLVLQVALIATFDKTNLSITRIDTSLSKLSAQYVTYDNYVTTYKSPIALNNSVRIRKTEIIYLNIKSIPYISYDFRLNNK